MAGLPAMGDSCRYPLVTIQVVAGRKEGDTVNKRLGIFKVWTGKWHVWLGIDWGRTVAALSAFKHYGKQVKFGVLCEAEADGYAVERRLYASLVLFLGLFGVQLRFVRKSRP